MSCGPTKDAFVSLTILALDFRGYRAHRARGITKGSLQLHRDPCEPIVAGGIQIETGLFGFNIQYTRRYPPAGDRSLAAGAATCEQTWEQRRKHP